MRIVIRPSFQMTAASLVYNPRLSDFIVTFPTLRIPLKIPEVLFAVPVVSVIAIHIRIQRSL